MYMYEYIYVFFIILFPSHKFSHHLLSTCLSQIKSQSQKQIESPSKIHVEQMHLSNSKTESVELNVIWKQVYGKQISVHMNKCLCCKIPAGISTHQRRIQTNRKFSTSVADSYPTLFTKNWVNSPPQLHQQHTCISLAKPSKEKPISRWVKVAKVQPREQAV